MESVSIVGFGRFGKTLYRILKDDMAVTLFDTDPSVFRRLKRDSHVKVASSLEEVYKNTTVFFAVPISLFDEILKSHAPYIEDHLLVDVLSVKAYPERIFKERLRGTKARYMLTHPMFGPDSVGDGWKGLPFVLYKGTAKASEYAYWKRYVAKKGFKVLNLTPREHDKFAAESQGVTHFVGRMLEEFRFSRTPLDTLGAKKLHEVREQTCNDTWELFMNLQNYNPYTKDMRLRLGQAFNALYGKLLPPRVQAGKTVFGIQGGIGSFNHEAVNDYIKRHHVRDPEIFYLFTTEKVMRHLHRGDIDFGLFAIHNSIGGIVDESIAAIARYKFHIVEEFAIPVRHMLMKRRDMPVEKLRTIMAHPQALRQCMRTLEKQYNGLAQVSGKGDLVDTARAAASLAEGKLSPHTALLGPKGLADIYGFDVFDTDLQDDKKNYTSFLMVRRM